LCLFSPFNSSSLRGGTKTKFQELTNAKTYLALMRKTNVFTVDSVKFYLFIHYTLVFYETFSLFITMPYRQCFSSAGTS
jgi:hypothetical protein